MSNSTSEKALSATYDVLIPAADRFLQRSKSQRLFGVLSNSGRAVRRSGIAGLSTCQKTITAWSRDASVITVFGEGRGFRIVWLLEEMGLTYRLRPVDLLAGVGKDAEFLAINPAGFIPAIQDGDVTMVESIAIMEYLMARYGPTPLAPDPHDPAFPAYQQFLHLGEAGLAASIYFVVGARNFAPESERQNWSAGQAQEVFESRLGLVTRQLARSPYLAGENFTAADISVTYALQLAQRSGGVVLGGSERAYVARTNARPAYERAMQTCKSTRAWAARTTGL
jgi:glutathione S-transferase